jgi:uncharacterized caspase-like protein
LGKAEGEFPILVPPHDSTLEIYAENEFGAGESATLDLKWRGPHVGDADSPHRVYALAVGIGVFDDKQVPRLSYPQKDAADFVRALKRQEGPERAFTMVSAKVIEEANASRKAIRDGLKWLVNSVGREDIGVLFLAGHGFEGKDSNFYYFPHNGNVQRLKDTAIVQDEVMKTLKDIRGYSILFIDTCHAAKVGGQHISISIDGAINAVHNQSKATFIYAAAEGEEDSIESVEWKNGAFTHAVVDGLDGGAAADKKHPTITTSMLESFIKRTVRDMTGGRQEPTALMPLNVSDLLVARLANPP